jgi:hypothetical protein
VADGSGLTLADLQQWYFAHCDGRWEHGNGLDIENIDNPGWSIEIDHLATIPEGRFQDPGDQHDWLMVLRKGQTGRFDCKLRIVCGPLNLERAIGILMGRADVPFAAEDPSDNVVSLSNLRGVP